MIKQKAAGWIFLTIGGALISYLLWADGPSASGQTSQWVSSQQCAQCHQEIYDEWKDSLHAHAFTDPDVVKLSNNFSNTDCIACHAPRPIFSVGAGNRVLPRQSLREEGVSCLSCHSTPHGMASNEKGLSGECQPVFKSELSEPIFCAGCHNQHGTVDEWEKTHFAQNGQTCNSCHMPLVTQNGKTWRSHKMPSKNDPEFIKSAIDIEVEEKDGQLWVTVTNSGAGHDFPTDSRHKAIDLVYRFQKDQTAEWNRLARFRLPYRDDQIDLVRTTLPSGESRKFGLPLPKGNGKIQLRFLYKTNPFMPDSEALVFWQEEKSFGQ